jgi:hypothetical protein
MPTTVACFHCGISTVVELERIPITIEYDHGEWERKCVASDLDDITLCVNMRAIFGGLGVPLEEPGAFTECRHDGARSEYECTHSGGVSNVRSARGHGALIPSRGRWCSR